MNILQLFFCTSLLRIINSKPNLFLLLSNSKLHLFIQLLEQISEFIFKIINYFSLCLSELKKRVKETSRQNSHQTRTKDNELCNNSGHNSPNDTSTYNFSFLFMFFSTFFSWLFSWFGSIRYNMSCLKQNGTNFFI